MQLVDTHCHIHSVDYPLDPEAVIARAHAAGVTRLLCVGTTAEDSERAVAFAAAHKNCWATVGLHPHDAKAGERVFAQMEAIFTSVPGGGSKQKIVAIGECGLDYFYGHSSKEDQEKALRFQIELAQRHNLPMIFHVREAFDDFWPIFDSYQHIRGVLHSFTDSAKNLDMALARGLYIGVNGIATFTKNEWQQQVYKQIPLERMLLETDAPFLTPVPLRGKVNQSAYLSHVGKFMSVLCEKPEDLLAAQTTDNAITLFNLQ
ncbi:MAG TPA: TatD family hydrolase [Candidatus Saccharimonadales bacterium]|nr:TatD family hydrolase [Candidatus Saccharimonadales bacterium]